MEELDLKELFEIFWSRKAEIILIIAIFLVIGLTYSFYFVSPKYKSETSLLIIKQDNANDNITLTTSDLTLNQKLVATYQELVTSKTVLKKVINNLNLDMSEEALKSSITVSSVKDTEMIKISVINADPDNAKIIASEVVSAFIDKVKEVYKTDNVNVIDEAEVPDEPCNINHTKDIIIFIAIGLVLAVVYVLILNMLDTTVKNKDRIEKELGLIVLSEIPLCNFNETKPSRRGGKK